MGTSFLPHGTRISYNSLGRFDPGNLTILQCSPASWEPLSPAHFTTITKRHASIPRRVSSQRTHPGSLDGALDGNLRPLNHGSHVSPDGGPRLLPTRAAGGLTEQPGHQHVPEDGPVDVDGSFPGRAATATANRRGWDQGIRGPFDGPAGQGVELAAGVETPP